MRHVLALCLCRVRHSDDDDLTPNYYNIEGGTVPIVAGQVVGNTGDVVYANPLPHVLILTAIVVGVSTTALALALIIRIRDAYGTLEENDILKLDQDSDG